MSVERQLEVIERVLAHQSRVLGEIHGGLFHLRHEVEELEGRLELISRQIRDLADEIGPPMTYSAPIAVTFNAS